MKQHDVFLAIVPHALSRDQTFRVYIGESMLAMARIAGQIRNEQSYWVMFQGHEWVGALFSPLLRRALAKRRELEWTYDSLDPYGSDFLEVDKRNLQIHRNDIVDLHFQFKRSMHAMSDVGIVVIRRFDGRRHRLVLVDNGDPQCVLSKLQRFYPTIEIRGKSRYRPPPDPVRVNYYGTIGSFLFAGAIVILWGIGHLIQSRLLSHYGWLILALLAAIIGTVGLFEMRSLRQQHPASPAKSDDFPESHISEE